MERLLIKNHDAYIRVTDGQYTNVGTDKASVFPMEHLDTVKGHVIRLKEEGVAGAAIFQLTIIEGPLDQNPSGEE
jgi:hypothetical protein